MDAVETSRRSSRPAYDFETELQNERSRASNPYNDAGAFERRVPGGESLPSSSSSSYPGQYQDRTVGQLILDRVGGALKGLFQNSQTILRVDLRQAIRYDVPLQRTPLKARPRGTWQPPNRRSGPEVDAYAEDVQSRGWFQGLQGGGARLKLMQIWETGQERLPLNFGFGGNVVMDRGEAEPKLRIRTKYAALHFFPEPYLELRGKWPLGETNLAVRARYRIPVSSMKGIWEPQSSQFLVNLYHRSGRLFHLTPGGVEFEDPTIPFGQFGTMRLAASVDFPRQLPLQEGEQPFRLRIMRLGLKSRIM